MVPPWLQESGVHLGTHMEYGEARVRERKEGSGESGGEGVLTCLGDGSGREAEGHHGADAAMALEPA